MKCGCTKGICFRVGILKSVCFIIWEPGVKSYTIYLLLILVNCLNSIMTSSYLNKKYAISNCYGKDYINGKLQGWCLGYYKYSIKANSHNYYLHICLGMWYDFQSTNTHDL